MAAEPDATPHRQLAGGAFMSLLVQILATAAGAGTTVVVARATGANGTGVYGLTVALLAAGTTVFGLDLNAGITYQVSRRAWQPRSAWRTAQLTAAITGVVGTGAFLLLQYLTQDGVLRGVTAAMALVVGIALPFAIAWTYGSAITLATERYETYALAQAIPAAASLLAVTVLVLSLGINGAVIGVAASYVAGWLYLCMRLARDFPSERTRPEARSSIRPALAFGLRGWGADVLQLINYRLDLFVLNAFAAQAVVGRYALAVSLTALGWVLPSALQTVLFPRIAADGSDSRATVTSALRHNVVLLTFSAVILALMLIAVPLVCGPEFRGTVGYGLLLLPGVLAIGFAKPLSAVITGRGYPQYSLYNVIITAPLTVGLYLVLVPPLGGVGAAVASSFSYTMSMIVAIYFFRRVTGMRVLDALSSPRAVVDDYVRAARNLRHYVTTRWSG